MELRGAKAEELLTCGVLGICNSRLVAFEHARQDERGWPRRRAQGRARPAS
jgi:hypothetical protein